MTAANDEHPLVSCLMVTANRARLARRALACLAQQSWPRTELVIVDDGDEDYGPMLRAFEGRLDIRYHRVARREGVWLGALRNQSLELARGELCVQWDDDEWYHPERISEQVRFLRAHDLQAVVLRYALWHLDDAEMIDAPYRIDGLDGHPGTVLHRRTALRYPNLRRSEDLAFMKALQREGGVGCMEHGSHLFIRCFHGRNTWSRAHFLGKLRRTWRGKLQHAWATAVRRDLRAHPAFALTPLERESVAAFLGMSRELGLLED